MGLTCILGCGQGFEYQGHAHCSHQERCLTSPKMNLPRTNQDRKSGARVALGGILVVCMMLASCRAPVPLVVEELTTLDTPSWVRLSRRLPTRDSQGWKLEGTKIEACAAQTNGDGVYLCSMLYQANPKSNAGNVRRVPILRCGDRFWLATENIARNQRCLAHYAQMCSCEQDGAHWDELVKAFVPPVSQTYIACVRTWVDEI